MRLTELIKTMFRSFFVIVTGTVASMYIFCLIFAPNATFTLNDIGRVLFMAILGDLPFLLFYSRKELGKRQMFVRTAFHIAVLLAVLMYLAYLWGWVDLNNPRQVIVMILLIIGVYAIVTVIMGYQDKKLAKELNDVLKRRYHS